jgi:hypothetical protein
VIAKIVAMKEAVIEEMIVVVADNAETAVKDKYIRKAQGLI